MTRRKPIPRRRYARWVYALGLVLGAFAFDALVRAYCLLVIAAGGLIY